MEAKYRKALKSSEDRKKTNRRDSFTDTVDELTLLILILATFGLVYFVARKPDTRNSKIHSLFKPLDFFEPQSPKRIQYNHKD